ncbi:acylneuraminate cytidylyltransferase [bacterium]|nr:acylneuraminate cytidylyltransferase [candidate division CSSED10-310 bacterium]
MKTICIIPARGGSKGIPYKNIREVAGKPLIAWSIDAGRSSDRIDRVFVSTDDRKIAEIARNWGAEVIVRPVEISGDYAASELALLHVLDWLKKNEQYEPDIVVFLQPTSPYRSEYDVDNAIQRLIDENFDSVFSACPEHFTGRWTLDESGRAIPQNFDPSKRPMRQESNVEYLENGSIYVVRTRILLDTGTRMGGSIGIHLMPSERSHQIDTEDDLALFDKLLGNHREAGMLKSRNNTIPSDRQLAAIRLLALDFDGVLTDNSVWVDQDGVESVRCSRADSLGLARLKSFETEPVVISTEAGKVVEARCQKLGIRCIRNSIDKASELRKLAQSMNIDRHEIAFIGNDINDLAALKWSGLPVLVADADPSLRSIDAWIVDRIGGSGAVRIVCDAICDAKERVRDGSV